MLLAACQSDDVTVTSTRTVIIYMSAENNLSPYAHSDTTEMIVGSKALQRYKNQRNNLIVYFDSDNGQEAPSIWKMDHGKAVRIKQYQEEINSADPTQMYEILSWIISQYPADDYGLVLWGHASGSMYSNDTIPYHPASSRRRAYGYDSNSNLSGVGSTWMNVPSMALALKKLHTPFKFIFCDCCNSCNIEEAYELRDVTEYYIAAPTEIPGTGADYSTIVPCFFSQSATFYQEIIDDYANSRNNQMPLAAIRTSQLEDLAHATKLALQTMQPTAEKDLNLDGLVYYVGNVYRSVRVMYDMNDLMMQNLSSDEYQQWKKAFDPVIAYKRYASTWATINYVNFEDFQNSEEKMSCISMYFPRTAYDHEELTKEENAHFHNLQWYWAVGWNDYGW